MLLLLVSACVGSRGEPWEGSGTLEGRVSAVLPGTSEFTRVRVEDEEAGREFLLVIGSGTRIVRVRPDGSTVRGGPEHLVPGARIQAEHTGVQLRSLAPQYEATRIRILPQP